MNLDPQKTIFLIDGSSFLYRAYYGLRPMHSAKGEPVQAVYGFCRMIKKLIDTFSPQHMVLVWDSKGKTTRHDMMESYKATRQAPPSDLFEQKERIVEFADLIGLEQVAQSGIEADDIMFSIAQEQKEETNAVVFVTSDKDMAQALDAKTMMYDTFKDILLDVEKFQELRGFPVSKLPFYHALLGDASDNIPGVRGIGKKGAEELVNQFESLEDVYANLDKVRRPRMRTALEANKDNAFLSRKLFLLQYHKSGVAKKAIEFNAADWVKARPLFEEFNFKSLLKGMPTPGVQTSLFGPEQQPKMTQYKFHAVVTKEQLRDLCNKLTTQKVFAMDTETTGVRPLLDEFVGVSFCTKEGHAYYVPFGHKTEEPQLSKTVVLQALQPILEDAQYSKYLHNVKFDQLVLRASGIKLQGVTFDSLIGARLAMQTPHRLGLKNLSEFYFDEPMLNYDEVVKRNKLKDFSYVAVELATRYSGSDSHQTLKLTKVLKKELKQEKLMELYKEVEHPLIQILVEMEARGIGLDTTVLQDLNTRITADLQNIVAEISALIGEEHKDINLNSPKQVEKLLFYELNLPPQKKRPQGGYSTDFEVLQKLAEMHPVPRLIIKYRELFKLKSTYIEALPTYVHPKTQRVHTTYSQTGVATGRLASSEPNLQNIPTASGYGIDIRGAFKPKPGYVFLSADYSQIELRVLAHFSQDANLLKAFLQGSDIHAETAARLFDVALQNVTHDQRQIGKRINFSILYGLTPYGLSKDLNISFAEAKQYIEKYFEQYPGVLTWMEEVIDSTKKNGYVTTWKGRRRYMPAIYEKNKTMYEEAKRVVINTRAQGTAAEIMKLGMINVNKAFAQHGLGAKMLLQIHDELLITVPEEQKEQTEHVVKQVLESVVDWQIPLFVTTRFGSNWKDVTK